MPTIQQIHYLKCDCGAQLSAVDHLTGWFGPWECPQCKTEWSGHIKDSKIIDILAKPSERKDTLVLLRSCDMVGEHYLFMIVKGKGYHGQPGDGDEYYYTQHTCPSNWLGMKVIHGNDDDPHGVFRWMATVKEPTQEEYEALIKPDGHPSNWRGSLNERDLHYESACVLFPELKAWNEAYRLEGTTIEGTLSVIPTLFPPAAEVPNP